MTCPFDARPIFRGYVSFREPSLSLGVVTHRVDENLNQPWNKFRSQTCKHLRCLAKNWPMGWTDWMEIWWDLGKGNYYLKSVLCNFFGVSLVASGPLLTFWSIFPCLNMSACPYHVRVSSRKCRQLFLCLGQPSSPERRDSDHLFLIGRHIGKGEPHLILAHLRLALFP